MTLRGTGKRRGSDMTLTKVKQRKLTTGREFWEISFEDGNIMLVAFRQLIAA